MTSVRIRLNTQRITKKGYPVVFQVVHNRQKKVIYTSYYIYENEFNRDKEIVATKSRSKRKLSEFNRMNLSLKEESDKIKKVIEILNRNNSSFDVKDIVNAYRMYDNNRYPETYTARIIEDLKKSGNYGTAIAYRSAMNKINLFLNGQHTHFEDIDYKFISDFEIFLKSNGAKTNTVNFYLRILKAIYNRALNEGVVSGEKHPFRGVVLRSAKSVKKAIDKDTIKQIAELDLSAEPYLEASRDIFLFSFYARGMPFVDCAFLERSNISDGNIIYYRHKTNQKLQIKIEKPLQQIIERYSKLKDFVLPILSKENPKPLYDQYRGALRQHNKRLKIIGERIGMDRTLSSYVSRHSWATIAKYHGIPLSVISEGLGHSSERTTYNYLAELDPSVLNAANEVVIHL